ncbi:uncharacterized protein LOC142644283 [Castanea sativa]|uniref:uncharacterized protein LOC142644283 n=1 Tax=Castanea sativa TaxID=21020 RepID=UPI003F651D3A
MANFNREEGEAICDIPLSRRQVPNLVYWQHSKDGNFTVKSTYKVVRSLLMEDWAETSSRAAQDIWHGSARALQKCGTGQIDFVALLEYLIDQMEKTEWNRVLHCGKFLEPDWLNKQATELLEEFQQSQESLQADTVHGVARQVLQNAGTSWQLLPQSVYKLNYDVAVFANNTSFGFGVVIKNSRGEVMATMTAKGLALQCSKEAKLLACRKAMEFATDTGFTTLIVEGDSVNATRSIASTKDNQSALGHIVGNIQHLIGALEWISVSYTKRNENKVAHVLARYAQHVNSDLFWMEEVP